MLTLVIHVYVKENRLDITSAGYPVNPPQQHFTGSASTPVCLHCYFCHIHTAGAGRCTD